MSGEHHSLRTSQDEVTQLLQNWVAGDTAATEKLFKLIGPQLEQIAHNLLFRERINGTLSTRDLVQEAFFLLDKQHNKRWKRRTHFYAITTIIMQRILADHVRKKMAQKRGGHLERVSLTNLALDTSQDFDTFLSLDRAIQKLAAHSPRQAQVILFRYYDTLSIQEIADMWQQSRATVNRLHKRALAWIREFMGDE